VLANLPPALPRAFARSVRWVGQRRGSAALIAIGGCLAFALVVAQARTNALTPLFSAALQPSQTMDVERVLTIWNEPFTADPQHTQIFVAAAHRRDVLLRLTLAGLPRRYVPTSLDVLEEPQSAFAPQSVIDDRRRAGIEGDLVAGLRRINGVADAAVVIAPAIEDPLAPEQSQAPASASVQLVMQAGAALAPGALSGIKRFVAAGYPGLVADRVVVLDGSASGAGAQPMADRSLVRETRLQESIQGALDSVFGGGAAIVRVNLRDAGIERSTKSTRVAPHGLLESDSGKEQGSDGGKRFERDRDRARYAYDTTVETQVSHADALAHVAIAVFLDSRRIGAGQIVAVKQLVKAAAGADLTSGDDVVVEALPFSSAPPPRSRLATAAAIGRLASHLLALAGLSGLVLLARRWHLEDKARSQASAASLLGSTLQRELPHTAAYVLSGLPPHLREQVLRQYPLEIRERIAQHLNGRTHG